MSVAPLRLYRSASLPQRLQAVGIFAYALTFAVLLVVGQPGLGFAQGFYVAIILVALSGTVTTGVCAGLAAAALYEISLAVEGSSGAALSSQLVAVRLVAYVAVGVIAGAFASQARGMLADALRVLDDLLHLARRDAATGALSRSGLDRVLALRVNANRPFTLLLGRVDGDPLQAADVLEAWLDEDSDVARVGPVDFAAVTAAMSLANARLLAEELERELDAHGVRATFGWTVRPTEGGDVWTLFRAASERLYARRLVRGEWTPDAATAELVEPLLAR